MIRDARSSKLKLGSRIPYFSLRGTDGRIYSSADVRDKKAVVVIFTCNHCPQAQAYDTRMLDMVREFSTQSVQFYTICSNDAFGFPTDSFEQMIEKSRFWGYPFPYLHDDTQIVAHAFDAACTPECYLFDGDRKLRYHGRIDDNASDPTQVGRRDLALAVEAVLTGGEVAVPLTNVEGCSIKWRS
jgi:peroxiredoxin